MQEVVIFRFLHYFQTKYTLAYK